MRDIMRAAMPSRGKPSSTEAARVMIERLGLAEQSEVRACDLSFGQQRLLALGKALIRNGQVLILDEPFSGLQQDAAFAVLELIHQAKPGRIVLVIDHTISGMRAVADRVWYMHRGRLTAFASYPEMEDSEVFKESYLGVRSKMEPRPNAPISIVHNDVPSERRKVALNGALYVGSTRGQMAKDMPLMSVKNLTGGYGGRDIVAAINLDLFPGDILCLIGRNGSGKSTLLRALMGALPRITGDIWLDSIPLTALSADKRVHLGLRLLPQEGRVLAGFSVRENLTLSAAGASASPYSLSLLANSEVRKIAENAETMFFNGRTPRPEQDAGKLSGGEQARLAFIQLEFGSSKVFLLDEPTAGIDGMARDRVEQFVYLAVGRGAAVMMIEHDLDFVTRIASRVAILSDSTMQELSFTPGEHSDQLVYRLSTGVGPSRQ